MKSIITKGRNHTVCVGDANTDLPTLQFLRHKVKYVKSILKVNVRNFFALVLPNTYVQKL